MINEVPNHETVYNDYTPDGKKLFSRHLSYIPNGNGSNSRVNIQDLYIDDLMLRGGTPLIWKFSGGYVELNANGTPTSWNYYVTDHLGSTRMVVDSNDSINEVINYYPFGSEMRMTNPALLTGGTSHPYRFTGKELDKVNNLNMYDFGARWYDVAGVPMWTSVDPLAEEYYNVSPYAYCGNNPVNRFDPDGRDWVKSSNNDYVWMDNVSSASETPFDYTYVGKTEEDILHDLNINTIFTAQTSEGGAIGIDGDERFGGAVSGNTYGLTGIANVSAIIDINVKNGTLNNSMGMSFKGIMFEVYFNQKGTSSNDNMSLEYKGNMRLQMNDRDEYTPLQYSRDLQIQPKGSISLSASRFFGAKELKKNVYFREIGIDVGATNPSSIFTKPASFTWNLMRNPIFRSK